MEDTEYEMVSPNSKQTLFRFLSDSYFFLGGFVGKSLTVTLCAELNVSMAKRSFAVKRAGTPSVQKLANG